MRTGDLPFELVSIGDKRKIKKIFPRGTVFNLEKDQVFTVKEPMEMEVEQVYTYKYPSLKSNAEWSDAKLITSTAISLREKQRIEKLSGKLPEARIVAKWWRRVIEFFFHRKKPDGV